MLNVTVKFGGIKEMLTKAQMKRIRGGMQFAGGHVYKCCDPGGGNCTSCDYCQNHVCNGSQMLFSCGLGPDCQQ
jgi:hypothetical protein